MTMKTTKTNDAADDTVLDSAAEVVSLTLVQPSDVADSRAADAARLDREIRDGFRVVLNSRDVLLAMIGEAKAQQIHKMLTDETTGKPYKSWTAYMANVIGTLGIDFKGLGKANRDGIVAMLYSTGMNQKTIADATQISLATVNRAVLAAKAAGEVGEVETENRDGSKQGAAKGGRPKVEKKPAELVSKALTAVDDLLDQVDEDELLEVKKILAAMTRRVNALTKK